MPWLALLGAGVWFWIIALLLRLSSSRPSAMLMSRLLDRLSRGKFPESGRGQFMPALPGPVFRLINHSKPVRLDPAALRGRCEEARKAELGPAWREIRFLRAMVAAAPLVGLLGTVMGMIGTFSSMAHNRAIGINLVSSGISQALITTQTGLAIALPGLVGANAAKRLAEKLDSDLERIASRMVLYARSHEGGNS